VTGRGEATALYDRNQYHVLANPSGDETALTLHVYGTKLMQLMVFHESEDRYRAEAHDLHLTEDGPADEALRTGQSRPQASA
jgi:hypothetical protein